MKARILAMAAAQAIRAAVTALIPITLVTLFGWASAGSDTGNTGDALRGSGMIWLASHHVFFDLHFVNSDVFGRFWFLPIGLLFIPYITLHGAGLRIARELVGEAELEDLVLASLALTFVYAVLVTVIAGLVGTSAVSPNPISAFFFGAMAGLLFGAPRILQLNLPAEIKEIGFAVRSALLILLTIGAVAVLVSLTFNFGEVINIVRVARLGLISGFFVFAICLLYLPNLAIWAVAYFTGIGFGFGTDSMINPWTTEIGSVPAVPIFAAIPAQAPPWAPYLILIVFAVFCFVGFRRIHALEYREVFLPAAQISVVVGFASLALAFFGGGAMVGGNLSAAGPSLWKFPLLMAAEAFVGLAIGALMKVLSDRVSPRQRLRRA